MREIKFRAWDYKNDEMREWKDIGNNWDLGSVFNNPEMNSCDIMQYTGLKDKNGKEIYEGDVVRIEETYIGDSIIAKHNASIIFDLGSFNVNHSNACFDTLAVNPIYWEVIGNIYENPELLNKD